MQNVKLKICFGNLVKNQPKSLVKKMLILSYHSYTILSCSHSGKEWPVFAHARLSGKYFTWQQYFSQYISRGGIGTHVGCPFIQGGPQFLQNSTMMYCGNELSFGFLLHDNQFQSLCLYFHHTNSSLVQSSFQLFVL